MRKLTYFIASTIDGCIAGPSGEFDFYPVTEDLLAFLGSQYPETLPTHGRAALGINGPNRRFDTVVMGRATYDLGLREGITSPYAHLRQYVVYSPIPKPFRAARSSSATPRRNPRAVAAPSPGFSRSS